MPHRLILVADDNEDQRRIATSILEREGFAVMQAVDGEEAVELATRHEPDLILMDLAMPTMDGWDALAALKDRERTKSIPVVAVTSTEPSKEEVRDAGFCAVLVKPVFPVELVKAAEFCMDAHARGERWLPDLLRRLSTADSED